ncbi:MAG TPA: hypothetical protein VJU77_11255 [Chthoniobacterales bacterium]|nr:hypothetical protein [Chthoniobacterales bacterium]
MFQSLRADVDGESWKSFLTVFFGTWLAVWFYAAVHNQYLIRIAPEHFTVWHYRMPFTQDYTLLGILYAGGASVSPGGILGALLYVAGRLFDRPRVPVRKLILSTAWVWLAVEVCALASGLVVWRTGRPLYPEDLYPANSLGLLITQTIQITAYSTGALFSIGLLFLTWRARKHLSRARQ